MIPQTRQRFQPVVIDSAVGRVIRLKKSVMNAARLIADRVRVPANNPNGWRYSARMITLTYRDGVEWKPEHVSDFLRVMQMWARRQIGSPLPYVWVMELTKRGRPHFHILVWCPSRLQIPKPDKRGWWKHGSRSAGSRVELVTKSAVGYVAKYASKGTDEMSRFPKGARVFGTGGLLKSERRVIAWWNLPKALRTGVEGSVSWKRAIGGGWLNRDTGERAYSDFTATWLEGTSILIDIDRRTMDDKKFARAWAIDVAMKRQEKKLRWGKVFRNSGDDATSRIERFSDIRARQCLNLSEYLAAAQQTNLYEYWSVFEAAERGNPVSATILVGLLQPSPSDISQV